MHHRSALPAAAVEYAAHGWHVLPLAPRGKVPVVLRGVHAATTDRHRIDRWWSDTPNANVGIAAGPSGVLVIDIDGEAGMSTMRDLLAEHDPLRRLPAAWNRTARGWHAVFTCPAELREVGPSAGALGTGLDVRAGWSYFTAPPSRHPSGHRYFWANACVNAWTRPPDPPRWLASLLRPPERTVSEPARTPVGDLYMRQALHGEICNVLGAGEGTRNDALYSSAFTLSRLVACGLDVDVIVRALTSAAVSAGLPEGEAARTVHSALRARGVAA